MSNNEVEKATIIYAIRETLKVAIADLEIDLSPRGARAILKGAIDGIWIAIGHLDEIKNSQKKGD